MWFGLEELLWQDVSLNDGEIIVYSEAHILLICILRSSPVSSLYIPLNCAVEEIPPHQEWNGFVFSAPWRGWNLKIHTREVFWLHLIIPCKNESQKQTARLLTVEVNSCIICTDELHWCSVEEYTVHMKSISQAAPWTCDWVHLLKYST